MMQNDSPPRQEIDDNEDAEFVPPPPHPASISALEKRRIERALRMMKAGKCVRLRVRRGLDAV
jgi:hypothetical protein